MFSNCIRVLQNQYVTAFAANICVMMTGAAFTWAAPVLPYLKEGQDAIIPMTATEISWMVSLIEVGSLFPPIPCGIISEKYGRKKGMIVAAPFLIAGWLVILLTRSGNMLYLARILQGVGLGSVFTIVPMYLGEIAAVNVRGSITCLVQTMWYVGILYQFTVGSYLSYNNSAVINIIFCATFFLFFLIVEPESPVFLVMKNRDQEATHNLMLLRGKSSANEVMTELQEIKQTVEKDMENKIRWSDLHLGRGDWKILILVELLTFFRLCSGTIGVSTYLSELLHKADWHVLSSELCLVLFGSVTIFSIVLALITVDKIGRRPLMLLSCFGSALSNAVLGTFYWCQDNTDIDLDSIKWIPFTCLLLYTFFFAMGLGPVTQTIQSELFPTHLRGFGNIVTCFNMIFTSFFCLRSYQFIVDIAGVYANFVLYCAICVTAAFVIYFYVPETKGKTFMEISDYFYGTDYSNETKAKKSDKNIYV